jgi:hemerythrin-like domain-containing protein
MKRSAALAPLSRDHQHALDAALRLRRAHSGSIGDAVAHFAAFFEDEGRHHFEIEERLLLPALPAEDAEWADAVRRIREDHAAIRAAADAASELSVSDAQALGQRIAEHVRFEERVAFGLLERRLDLDERPLGTSRQGS